VQGIFPLAVANVGIRLTTAKWYTPGGQAISGAGIKPDIEVQRVARPLVTSDSLPAPTGPAISGAGIKPDIELQRVARPLVTSEAPPAPATDAILEAGLQAARLQASSQPITRRP
jgi:carboxyl-terminal processing protease